MNTITSTFGPTTSLCNLTQFELRIDPFAHVMHDQFIAPEFYRQLSQSFPTCPPGTGPTGFSLFWGDEGYQRLLDAQPVWRALFDTFHSQHFIDWSKQQFAAVWDQEGCRIKLKDARYVPYREDRIDKERTALRKVQHAPNELWVRMDIYQGKNGYDRPIHLDHRRRLMTMLLYMYDPKENQMAGGELFLHDSERPEPSRKPGTRITPRHNLMVAFPCSPRSYHSVSPITSMAVPRNYIQVHISSSIDIWPTETPPHYQRPLAFLKRLSSKLSVR